MRIYIYIYYIVNIGRRKFNLLTHSQYICCSNLRHRRHKNMSVSELFCRLSTRLILSTILFLTFRMVVESGKVCNGLDTCLYSFLDSVAGIVVSTFICSFINHTILIFSVINKGQSASAVKVISGILRPTNAKVSSIFKTSNQTFI